MSEKESKIEVSIRQEAIPYSVVVRIPDKEIQPKFQEYWNSIKDKVSPSLTKGFRKSSKKKHLQSVSGITPETVASRLKGGLAELYGEVLRSVVVDSIKSNFNREILVLESLTYHVGSSDSEHAIKARFFPEPQVVFNDPEMIKNLEVEVPAGKFVDEVFVSRIESLKKENAKELDKEGAVEDGNAVVVDINAQIDGAIWEKGCLSKNKMIVTKDKVFPSALYENLLGMSVGEKKICTVTLANEFGPELEGKELVLSVHVRSVLLVLDPVLNDEFAKSKGFESLEDMQTKFRDQIQAQIKEHRDWQIINAALFKLIENSKMSPVPESWISMRCEEDVKKAEASSGEKKSDKEKEEVSAYTSMSSQRELIQVLTLKAYGQLVEIPLEEGEGLVKINGYLNRVKDFILKNAKVIEKL
jgi:FKBP-type peptidyl-prolyl cis-trans isomerase (trigger factor)